MKYKKHLANLAARQAFYDVHPSSAANIPYHKDKDHKFTRPGSNKS